MYGIYTNNLVYWAVTVEEGEEETRRNILHKEVVELVFTENQ